MENVKGGSGAISSARANMKMTVLWKFKHCSALEETDESPGLKTNPLPFSPPLVNLELCS